MNIIKNIRQTFTIKDFEGPLDLLLFLLKKNELNIYDIPVSEITEQYLHVLNDVHHELDDLTDFFIMATTLLHIKSRMLLPVELCIDEDVEDPRKDLVERLIEYQKYKKLTQLMVQQEESSEWYLQRKQVPMFLPCEERETESLWDNLEIWDLTKRFSQIMQGLSNEKILSLYEEVSVNEKIALIYEYLEINMEFFFGDLITRPGSLLDVVCAFLAILECSKNGTISLQQKEIFSDILIFKQAKSTREYYDA